MRITDIRQFCINPYDKSTYRLIGIVSYKGHMATRKIQTGHYTAVCPRAGTWIEYDDLDKKERYIKENTKLVPALLIYAKEK